jgi:hypothetical protein
MLVVGHHGMIPTCSLACSGYYRDNTSLRPHHVRQRNEFGPQSRDRAGGREGFLPGLTIAPVLIMEWRCGGSKGPSDAFGERRVASLKRTPKEFLGVGRILHCLIMMDTVARS